MVDLKKFLAAPETSIRDVIELIDRNGNGLALLVDSRRHLVGTISDGDIRRAILAGTDLNSPAKILLKDRAATDYPKPITAPDGTPDTELVRTMNKYVIRQIPLL